MNDHISEISTGHSPMPATSTPLWCRWWMIVIYLTFVLLLWFMVNLFFFSQSPLETAIQSSPDSALSTVLSTDLGKSTQSTPNRKPTPPAASKPSNSQPSAQRNAPPPTDTTTPSTPHDNNNQPVNEEQTPPRSDSSGPVLWADSLFGIAFPIDRQSLQNTLGVSDLEVTDFFIASPGTHAVLHTVTSGGERYTLWTSRHHAWEPDTSTPGGMPWDSSEIPWRVNGVVPHSGNVEEGTMYAGGTIELSFSDGSVYYSDDIGASWYQQ